MGFKIKKGFILIILILVQSCSGGRIGNFFESSFKNIEEPKIKEITKNNSKENKVNKFEEKLEKNTNIEEPKIKEITKNNSKKNKVNKFEEKLDKNKNIEEPKIKEITKNNSKKNIINNFEEKLKKNKKITNKNMSRQKGKFQPQSYKIIFILKDVDPKDPIEELSTILRNSDVNFEIEKIERFMDSENKIIKRN